MDWAWQGVGNTTLDYTQWFWFDELETRTT